MRRNLSRLIVGVSCLSQVQGGYNTPPQARSQGFDPWKGPGLAAGGVWALSTLSHDSNFRESLPGGFQVYVTKNGNEESLLFSIQMRDYAEGTPAFCSCSTRGHRVGSNGYRIEVDSGCNQHLAACGITLHQDGHEYNTNQRVGFLMIGFTWKTVTSMWARLSIPPLVSIRELWINLPALSRSVVYKDSNHPTIPQGDWFMPAADKWTFKEVFSSSFVVRVLPRQDGQAGYYVFFSLKMNPNVYDGNVCSCRTDPMTMTWRDGPRRELWIKSNQTCAATLKRCGIYNLDNDMAGNLQVHQYNSVENYISLKLIFRRVDSQMVPMELKIAGPVIDLRQSQ